MNCLTQKSERFGDSSGLQNSRLQAKTVHQLPDRVSAVYLLFIGFRQRCWGCVSRFVLRGVEIEKILKMPLGFCEHASKEVDEEKPFLA